MNYKDALEFATEKHSGQYRRHGKDYITHPLRVVEILRENNIDEEDLIFAGIFHDLLEDTDTTEEEILTVSNKRVLDIVKLLTKKEGYIIDEYIYNISNDNDASLVKLADRLSNLEDSLLIFDKEFIKKYIKNTEDYYIELSKGTVFELKIKNTLKKLKLYVEKL